MEWLAKVAVPDLSAKYNKDNPSFPAWSLGPNASVGEAIKKFAKRQNQKVNDIYQFKSYEEFEKYLEESKTNRDRLAEEADVVHKDDRWALTHPKTHWAMQNVGGSTDWCAATENGGHWKDYARRGPFVVIKDKSVPDTDPMHKIAVHGRTHDDNFGAAGRDLTFYKSNGSVMYEKEAAELAQELPDGVEEDIAACLSSDDYHEKQHEHEEEASEEAFEEEGVGAFFWAFNRYLNSKYQGHDSDHADSLEELAKEDAALKDEVKHLAREIWCETQQHPIEFDGYNFSIPHPDENVWSSVFDKKDPYGNVDDEAFKTFEKLVELYLDKSNIYSEDINSRLHDYGRIGAREALIDRYGKDFEELGELIASAKRKIYMSTSGREGQHPIAGDEGFKFKSVPDGMVGAEMILRKAGYDEDADFIRKHVLESSPGEIVSAMSG